LRQCVSCTDYLKALDKPNFSCYKMNDVHS
jgi:hypothetical protein